jgi:hypothetical protein
LRSGHRNDALRDADGGSDVSKSIAFFSFSSFPFILDPNPSSSVCFQPVKRKLSTLVILFFIACI